MTLFKYAGIKTNDVANAPGISVSVYLQGCPHHCDGCFNPETWDFNGGIDFTDNTMKELLIAMRENGIKRNLCILGGEPLCPQNREHTLYIIEQVLTAYPDTPVYIWTGYLIEDLFLEEDNTLKTIFNKIDYIIDGPFIKEEKDLTLKMRGSRNQRIFNMKEIFYDTKIKL